MANAKRWWLATLKKFRLVLEFSQQLSRWTLLSSLSTPAVQYIPGNWAVTSAKQAVTSGWQCPWAYLSCVHLIFQRDSIVLWYSIMWPSEAYFLVSFAVKRIKIIWFGHPLHFPLPCRSNWWDGRKKLKTTKLEVWQIVQVANVSPLE